MDTYLYSAALWCRACIAPIKARLDRAGRRPAHVEDEATFDSDQYPKGPFPDGGGESDYPQHCDGCNLFLENPLTGDGYEYVRETIAEARESGRTDSVALTDWAPYYGPPLTYA